MPGVIIVAGVPGVGKTTVLQELETVAEKRKIPLKIINFGDVMNQLFKKEGKQIHRDQMRRQDLALQARVQLKAARKVNNMLGRSTLVVDTHMFVRTADGIWPGTPKRVLDAIGPDLIVLIEADPDEVAKRRKVDRTRDRESNSVEEVKADLEWSRYMASADATLAGIPIQIVQNMEGSQNQAAKELLKIIDRLR